MNVYRIWNEDMDAGAVRVVQAPTFGDAAVAWRRQILEEWKLSGDYEPSDEGLQPGQVELIAERPVIVAQPPGGESAGVAGRVVRSLLEAVTKDLESMREGFQACHLQRREIERSLRGWAERWADLEGRVDVAEGVIQEGDEATEALQGQVKDLWRVGPDLQKHSSRIDGNAQGLDRLAANVEQLDAGVRNVVEEIAGVNRALDEIEGLRERVSKQEQHISEQANRIANLEPF